MWIRLNIQIEDHFNITSKNYFDLSTNLQKLTFTIRGGDNEIIKLLLGYFIEGAKVVQGF